MRRPLEVALSAALFLSACKTAEQKPEKKEPLHLFPAPKERVQLQFTPPLGKVLKERALTERTEDDQRSSVDLSTETYFTRSDKGFTLSQTVTALKASQNGKPIDDPLAQLVTRFPVKVEIAKDGAFIRLLNPDDARKAVEETFKDPDQQDQVMSFFTPDAIEDQARVEWEEKYQGLFGTPLSADTPVYSIEATAVGETPIVYVLERTVLGEAKTDFGDAVALSVKCVQKPEDAKDKAAYEAFLKEHDNPALDKETSCSGRQVMALDPFVPISSTLVLKNPKLTLSRDTEAEALK